jgi:hypothetical protein
MQVLFTICLVSVIVLLIFSGVFMNYHALVATVSSRSGICPDPLLTGTFDTASKSLSLFV